MSKADELKSKNENLFERNTILLNENERLKKENAEYKEVFGSCDTCKRTCDIGNCCNPRTKNGYLLDKVKAIVEIHKLKKENAKLKLKLEALDGETPWKDIKDKNEVVGQLTQAKEILKKLASLEYIMNPPADKVRSLMVKAEQFLKEIEK